MYNQGKLQNGVKIKGIKKSLAMFENVDDKNIHDIIYIQNNVDVFFFYHNDSGVGTSSVD